MRRVMWQNAKKSEIFGYNIICVHRRRILKVRDMFTNFVLLSNSFPYNGKDILFIENGKGRYKCIELLLPNKAIYYFL